MIREYSILAFFLQLCAVLYAIMTAYKKGPAGDTPSKSRTLHVLVSALLILTGILLRFYRLGEVPYGLNNDEASIGYDAWALATYGMDRNGYPWPVYPITWGGGGGGPMVVYLAVLTERILGHSVFSLRLPSAVLGVLTLPLFYLLLRKAFGFSAALAGLMLLVLNPWHLLMSRFTLDCNTFAFWLVLALLLFMNGVQTGRTSCYLLSSAVFAVCLYVYGSATIVIPVFLLLTAACACRKDRLTLRQLFYAMIVFIVILLPLIIFYAINIFDLPAIVFTHFSVPRFETSRSVFYHFDADLFRHMSESLAYMIRFLTTGPLDTEVACNQVPGYGVFYRFTFSLTLTGLILSVRSFFHPRRSGDETLSDMNLLLFLCTVLFTLFLRPEISRMTLLLVPVLIFQAIALRFILENGGKKSYAVILLTVCLGGVLFTRNYFGSRYREASEENFMAGYGDAILYAEQLRTELVPRDDRDVVIYSTYRHVAAPFAVALYYTQTPVQDYLDTVTYRAGERETRIATSFTHYRFGLPQDIHDVTYADDILILHEEDFNEFVIDDYDATWFCRYAVCVRKENHVI